MVESIAATVTVTSGATYPFPYFFTPPQVTILLAQFAPFRLQGIFYNAKEPSAIVNGQTLPVGGQLGDWRVTAIEPLMVTLQNPAGQVQKLTLK